MADEISKNSNFKISLNDFKGMLEKENISSNNKLLQIFNFFDKDGNGDIESVNSYGVNEIQSIWSNVKTSATKNGNSIFENSEAQEFLANSVDSTGKTLADSEVSQKDLFSFLNVFFKTPQAIEATEAQEEALSFLKNLTSEAEATFKAQEAESGVISDLANEWRVLFGNDNNRYEVRKAIEQAKEDLKLLEEAAYHGRVEQDARGRTHLKSFEEAFQERRGIEFDENAIMEFSQKADEFVTVKTTKQMFDSIKSELVNLTISNIDNEIKPYEATAAILKALNYCGVTHEKEINKILKEIEKKYKDHPVMKKYQGGLYLGKTNTGKWCICRSKANDDVAPPKLQRLIADEIMLYLDKKLATILGIKYDEDISGKQLTKLINKTYQKQEQEYEESFKKAYGKSNVKELAEAYSVAIQQDLGKIEMISNLVSTAVAIGSGGFLGGVFAGAVSTLRVTYLIEQLTSENGMSKEEWKEWGNSVLENTIYMSAGMGVSKLAQQGAAIYKTKALVKMLKKTGKSTDDVLAMVKSNPAKFPKDIYKSFSKIDKLAKGTQVSTEIVLDLGSTLALNKVMNNGDLLPMDVINSFAFALMGGFVQKDVAKLTGDKSKVKIILKEFDDYGITKADAENILKAMDDISTGKIKDKDIIPLDELLNYQMLDEVVVTAKRSEIELEGGVKVEVETPKVEISLGQRLETVSSREEFVANNPELKDNKWIQENIETLLDVCNDANNYGAPLVNLKEKMLHPLLKQHRLEILNTFLSDPNLYNDKQLQQGFKNLLYTYDAKSSKEMVESLKWYANLKDAEMQNTRNGLTLQMLDTNNLKDSYGYCLLTNRQLSFENKKLIYEYIYENNSFELNRNASNLRELCYKISNNDNINFLLNHFNELGSNPFFDRFFTSGQNPDDAKAKISMYEYFKSINEDLQNDDILLYITSATKDNANFIKENYNNPVWKDYLPDIVYAIKDYNSNFALELMNDTEFPKELIKGILDQTYKYNVDFIRNELYKNPNVPRGEIANIAQACSVNTQGKFCVELISDKDFPIYRVADLLRNTYDKTIFKFAKVLYADSNIPKEDLVDITDRMNGMNIDAKKEVYKTLSNLEGFPKEQISKVLIAIDDNASNKDYALKLCQEYSKMELTADKIAFLVENYGKIAPKQLQKLTRIAGKNNVAKLSNSDLVIACQVADLYGKTNINEIPIEGKKEALRSLVACNEGLFDISPEMQKMFPMLPTDRDAYCSLLPSIVRSLGIETNTLTSAQTTRFNQSLTDLSGSLAKISDADFAELRITQEYSKDDFIRNVLKIVKDLPIKERQKVYDYFGFELHHNKGNQTGFSITGYPVNLNNGKKLAQITDPRTKEIVELLRPEVIKFSEENPIRCNNPQIEQLLNDVVDVLPELRAQIGKSQHGNNGTKGSHNFDVLQHSLKVMQKISQDPKFKELNESDQKVMMLASLLHDITKREGSIDKTHANESAFDTFFIAKKFNLTREEEIKLYTLAKHHEWLEYVNTSKSEEQLTKRLQSVAYDLQNDNLFDMALMFTHADLRAVKVDDTFHDTTVGSGRKAFDGTVRSYGESADVYAKRIQNYIKELQKSQPLLPVTKIPTASRIAEAITVVRPDGSTNIKGVYKDKDGLIVIKYNEVEDWEAIGFPKGSVSRGIEAQKGINYGDEKLSEDVDTGNIKFFAHGLDYENQLAKFDAFGLVDSDVLLSISYAERPESKYRFFRAQGVLLDFDTKYVHGGGNTDSGSGCGKTIADFKKDYIFGGERETDRLYVSDLIKKATGMSDSEYIEFIKANENKPLSEIEPVELRETIVRAFASINSNTRKGAREYNEMYGSNPKEVMAVFAYSVDYTENLGNPVDFLNRTKVNPNERHSFGKALPKSVSERTEFLRRYALEHNVPFVVFGD